MTGDGGFLVEEFLDAISGQLDRTQDSLAAKAKVRPLMFALRNFAIDLQVFVSMDAAGNVRLRSAAPGETGASTLKLDFTTITRPMVEENTISLAMAQAPSLTEVGFKPDEQRALERFGVRTVAQLQTLRASGAGVDGIARLTDGLVPADRLRAALRRGRPVLGGVTPVPVPVPSSVPAAAPNPAPTLDPAPTPTPQVVQVPPGTRRLELVGSKLLAGPAAPVVRLDGRPLEHVEAADDRLEVELPETLRGGALEVDLGDDEPIRYRLHVDHVEDGGNGHIADLWTPGVES
jgi:hypothetical protein